MRQQPPCDARPQEMEYGIDQLARTPHESHQSRFGNPSQTWGNRGSESPGAALDLLLNEVVFPR
jgi:hypothetical protein